MTIGGQIRRFRKESGMTQKDLGNLLGISPQMVAQYETGKRKPKLETSKKIAEALGVSLIDLGIITDDVRDAMATLLDAGINSFSYGDTGENPQEQSRVNAIAAYLESGEFADEELDNILAYAEFIKSRRQKKTEK